MPYERPNIQRLTAYTPGEQPTATRLVKLNTNENPYPPCDAVMEAIRSVAAESLRRYPPPTAPKFRQAAAKLHGLEPDQVLATNGGDELLRMAVSVFCLPGEMGGASRGGLGETYPTYSLYDVLADIHDTPAIKVPLNEDWSLPDPRKFAQAVIDAGCRLVMVVNPHAPSGRLEPPEVLRELAAALKGHAVLLIDEAYVNFAKRDAVELLRESTRGELDNVLILRTLSKGYSLAGLRFGYGLGHPSLIAALDKARDSYNTDALAQAAALAAIQNTDEARKTWDKVIEQRAWLTDQLRQRGFTVAPSESNFVLAQPTQGPGAKDLYQSLASLGVFVRYFDHDRLRDKLRITIGTPEQNTILLQELDRIAGSKKE
ncbi:MAG: histidinol-phosphate transaminase [Phycisphaera sp.]|nr:histidinol-phosphate transaminase [Phycisphaera sp.]